MATVIKTAKAPPPNPWLNQAMVHNGHVFCSGALGVIPETGALVEGTIADRTVSIRFVHTYRQQAEF